MSEESKSDFLCNGYSAVKGTRRRCVSDKSEIQSDLCMSLNCTDLVSRLSRIDLQDLSNAQSHCFHFSDYKCPPSLITNESKSVHETLLGCPLDRSSKQSSSCTRKIRSRLLGRCRHPYTPYIYQSNSSTARQVALPISRARSVENLYLTSRDDTFCSLTANCRADSGFSGRPITEIISVTPSTSGHRRVRRRRSMESLENCTVRSSSFIDDTDLLRNFKYSDVV